MTIFHWVYVPYILRIFSRKCSDIRDRALRSWCIRFAEMCLKKVTRFPTKHDAASEAVRKFPHILLRSYTERIDPAKCQNYFIQPVNSAHRDFFSCGRASLVTRDIHLRIRFETKVPKQVDYCVRYWGTNSSSRSMIKLQVFTSQFVRQ